jgi:hypothetical protein
MKRQLNKAIILPATEGVLYNSYFTGEKYIESIEDKFSGILGLFFRSKKKIWVLDKNHEENFQGDLWKALKIAKQNGYKIIVYNVRTTEQSNDEILTAWQDLYENNIADVYLEIKEYNDFFKAIEDYDINPQNSMFVVRDYNIVEFISKRYWPRNLYSDIGKSSDLLLGFYMFYLNKTHVKLNLQIYITTEIYLCRFFAHYSQLTYLLYSARKLPFLSDAIIYIEEAYQEEINEFIKSNLDWIKSKAFETGSRFIYLQSINYELNKEFQAEYFRYFYPNISDEEISTLFLLESNFNVDFLQSVISKLNLPNFKSPALLRNRESVSYNSFEYSIYSFDDRDLRVQFENYFINLQRANDNTNVLYQLRRAWEHPEGPTSDELFDEKANILADDIIQKINYLKSEGLNSLVAEIALRMMDGLDPLLLKEINSSIKLPELNSSIIPVTSRLRIEWTSKYDFQIILPDYGNMIVDMPRLPKALFYFFLQHPEGVLFDKLSEYEDELMSIYSRISNLSDKDEIRNNVKRLIEPFDNSINVNCSRIKGAFVKLIDEKLAINYFVTGNRKEPKKIKLSRDLVEIIDMR